MSYKFQYKLETVIRWGAYKENPTPLLEIMKTNLSWVGKQYKDNPHFIMDSIALAEFMERVAISRGWRGKTNIRMNRKGMY